ncbi:MAG: S8 family serine peptidase, partial [Planctomycetota bacterium]|nr:S8 family serine peptidase [Planctomycetota bacterium]
MTDPTNRTRALFRLGLVVCLGLALGPWAVAEEEAPKPFPDAGLMPKAEIGADRFLAEHPQADGRGIVVAIFDTGVDPGAPGLQKTTDGKPKIVDLVDGSGSGDVDTSTVRKAKDGVLEGLGGRALKVKGIVNPTGTWHVGLKPAFELFPRGLVRRLKTKRRKAWDEQQRAAEATLVRRIADLADAKEAADRRARRDATKRLEQLRELQEGYEDPGPIFDCAVFHDGNVWRAVIDTDEDGDLADEEALSTYRIAQEWATFSDEARLNFGINVYDEGKRLSIVVDCGAHGTHVAGIVAAHYPDQPELNGIAPGAQIVSVKIGDTRMGSASMGTGEERGLIAALRNGCHLINMSYGGPTPTPNRTRMEKLYTEIVNEHNVIFVSSAGNEGPALSTVAAPGGTCEALFGVGA